MSQQVDFILDPQDQDLLFKSSDGKLFSVSKARAMESNVWKDMLSLGQSQKENQGIITLSEKSENLLLFFSILDSKDWLLDPPNELQMLQADGFVSLIEAAAKYDAKIVMICLYLELKKRLWPNIDEMKDWKGFKQDGWDVTHIMKFFVISQSLPCPELANVAAKMTFLISDLVEDQTEESSKLIDFRFHFLPLHIFRKRWDNIRRSISSNSFFTSRRLHFLVNIEEKKADNSVLWTTRKTAQKLDEALLNLEYKGLDELSKAEDKSE